MRILLASQHVYPIANGDGCGLHPKKFPSGSGYHLHDLLAKGLAEEGHQVVYQVERAPGAPLPRGVEFVSEPVCGIDVCHTIIGPPGSADQLLAHANDQRKPCLLTCHMLRPGTPAGSNWIFVSRSLARAYASERFVVNGIDPDNYIFSESKQDYLLFMSAMDKAIPKGLDLALALSRRKGFRLIVAGTGQTYEKIRHVSELCSEAGAEYVGDVLGARKAELFAGAKAFLFPSRLNEGCPLVILEAMFSGTPVISSTNGGSVEIVTPETGILCDSEDKWDEAVDGIATISPKRCREVAFAKFHYRRMVSDYVKEYERELGSQPVVVN